MKKPFIGQTKSDVPLWSVEKAEFEVLPLCRHSQAANGLFLPVEMTLLLGVATPSTFSPNIPTDCKRCARTISSYLFLCQNSL